MTEFDNISGFDGWGTKLMALLEEAENLGANASVQDRLALSRRFRQFIVESHPNTDDIMELDAIAKEAASAVLKQGIEERLGAIAGRTAELTQLTKGVERRALQLEAAASSIRLESATRAVNSLTDSVGKLKELLSDLQAQGAEDLRESVERAVTAIQSIRNRIEQRG